MTESELRALVAHTQTLLGLETWRIRVHIGEVPDEKNLGQRIAGGAIASPEYQEGDIYLDPEQIAYDHADPQDVVRHELLHIAVSPLAMLGDLWAEGDPARDKFVTYVHEQVVTQLECMPLWHALEQPTI